jgi:hypothetical protein
MAFFAFWADPGTNTFYIQINNGLIGPVPMTHALPNSVSGDLFLRSENVPLFLSGMITDEVGIWRGVLLDDDRTYLFNSGAGRTYPDVPYA